MKKQAYKKVYFWMDAAARLVESRKYSEGKTMSKASKKIQQRVRKERMGSVESKAEMKEEQKPLARANKFRAVN